MDKRDRIARDLIAAGEEHFQIAMQAGRVMFWSADPDGACELVSANWTQTTGQNASDALGDDWLDAVADADRAFVADTVRRSVVAHCGFYLRYRLRHAASPSHWVLHDASPRFLPSGKFNGLIATLYDCGDAHAGEAETETIAQRVYSFIDGVPLGAVAVDMDGKIAHCNAALCATLAIDYAHLLGADWIGGHVAEADRPRLSSLIDGRVPLSELPREMEFSIATREGPRLFRWHLTLIRDFDGAPVSLTLMGSDITQWRRLGDSVRLSARVFETSVEAMLISDRDNNIISVNASFTRLTGYPEDEVIGKNPRILSSGRHDLEFYRRMWDEMLDTGHWRGDIWDRRKDGSVYPKYLAITAIRDGRGEITHYSAVFHDVSDRKAIEERLDRLAHFDELTGLPNRSLLQDRLEQAIVAAERRKEKLALLFIDLDGFKPVNDRFGHAVGDEVLKQVAERLRNAIRGMDTAARLGGDEFVVILTDIPDATAAVHVSEKIASALAEPYAIDGARIELSASVGVSLYPHDGEGATGLLRSADQAMYSAKRSGKQRVSYSGDQG